MGAEHAQGGSRRPVGHQWAQPPRLLFRGGPGNRPCPSVGIGRPPAVTGNLLLPPPHPPPSTPRSASQTSLGAAIKLFNLESKHQGCKFRGLARRQQRGRPGSSQPPTPHPRLEDKADRGGRSACLPRPPNIWSGVRNWCRGGGWELPGWDPGRRGRKEPLEVQWEGSFSQNLKPNHALSSNSEFLK